MKRVILFSLGVIATILLSACGSDKEVQTPINSVEVTTVTEETTIEETTTEAVSELPTLLINESGTLKNWSVTVTNCQILDKISENQYSSFTPDEGNKYLLVTVSVANNGKSAETFMPSFGMNDDVSAKVLYGDGYEFSLSNLMGYSKNLIDTHLNPLSSKVADIAFEIPDAVASSEEELILKFTADKDELNYKLR